MLYKLNAKCNISLTERTGGTVRLQTCIQ